MRIFKKVIRVLLWISLSLLAVVLVVFALLNIPGVQRYVGHRVEAYMEKTLGTDVRIGALGWSLPKSVSAKDVLLKNPEGDTILYLENMEANIALFQLVHRKLVLEKVELTGVRSKIVTTDTNSNIAFLLEAFTPVPAPDTTAAAQAAAWNYLFPGTDVKVKDAVIYYRDDPAGMLFDLDIDLLTAEMNNGNVVENRYNLDNLLLENSRLRITLANTSTDTTGAEKASPDFFLQANQAAFHNVDFSMDMDTMHIAAVSGNLSLEGFKFQMTEEGQLLENDRLQWQQGSLTLDMNEKPPMQGFDPMHMALDIRDADIENLRYSLENEVSSVNATVNTLQAEDRSGLQVQEFNGELAWNPELLELKKTNLDTPKSHLATQHFRLKADFTNLDTFDLIAENFTANLDWADMRLFVPPGEMQRQLNQYFSKTPGGQQVYLALDTRSDQEKIRVQNADIEAPGIDASFTGSFKPTPVLERQDVELSIGSFAIYPHEVLPLMPKGSVPPYVVLPQQWRLAGKLSLDNDRLNLDVRLEEWRTPNRNARFVSTSSARPAIVADISGAIGAVSKYPGISADLRIDTLYGTASAIAAYLPKNTIPPGYELPQRVGVRGNIEGTMSRMALDVALQFSSGTQQPSFVQMEGTLRNLDKPEVLAFDVAVPEALLQRQDLLASLPDSLFPADVQVPEIRLENSRFTGSADSIGMDVTAIANGTTLNVEGFWAAGKYSADGSAANLDFSKWLVPSAWDSLPGREMLDPMDLRFSAQGDTVVGAFNLAADMTGQGQVFRTEGTYENDLWKGNLIASHDFVKGNFDWRLDFSKRLPEAWANMNLDTLDLYSLGLTPTKVAVAGKMEAETTGFTLDTLDARLFAGELDMYVEGERYPVDSMLVTASFLNEQNDLHISSDALRLDFTGNFDPYKIGSEVTDFFNDYMGEGIRPPVDTTLNDFMNLYVEVYDTALLTSGIVPGLTEVSPFFLNANYEQSGSTLRVYGQIPHMQYRTLTVDTLEVQVRTDEEVKYQVTLQKADIAGMIQLGNTSLTGATAEQSMTALFATVDSAGAETYRLEAQLDLPPGEGYRLRLSPTQVLNGQTWTMTPGNYIWWKTNSLEVADWQLSNGAQTLTISSPDDNSLRAGFANFDLATVSQLVKANQDFAAGTMNGQVTVNEIFSQNPLFTASLDVAALQLQQVPYGHLHVEVENARRAAYAIQASLEGEGNDLKIGGTFGPENRLALNLDVNSLKMESVVPLSANSISDATGYLTGNLAIGGALEDPTYRGRLHFENTEMNVVMLNTRFGLGDQPLVFENNEIRVSNLQLTDVKGNTSTLSATLTPESLMEYGIDATWRTNRFVVMNTTKDDNELYYGYLVVDATAEITGTLTQPNIELTAQPLEGSHLTYVYTNPALTSVETGAGIVRFVDIEDWKAGKVTLEEEKIKGQLGFDLLLNLRLTTDFEATVITNPTTGDQFTGKGIGDLTYRQTSDGKMEMVGTLEMREGIYDFTFQSVIKRRFDVKPGSTIAWTGNPLEPELNLTVQYETRTSPYPLIQATAVNAGDAPSLRNQQTFLVSLNMTGTLVKMDIKTNIEYPLEGYNNAHNSDILTALDALRSDESRLNTQASALLLFNGFLSDTGFGETYAGPSQGLNQFFSRQINRLADSYLGFVELDFNIESYLVDETNTATDYRVSLRKSLFDDRFTISIDGVTTTSEAATVRTDPTAEANILSQTYIDNLTAEYSITRDGKLKIKLFNTHDYDDFAGGNVMRIGGRLAFSRDFERWFWQSKEK